MKFKFALIAAMALSACATKNNTQTAAQKAIKLEVLTHTASDAGFDANSHLITGPTEAVLIDAQFTRSEAKKVAALVKKSGKNLTSIFISHEHPDHYFGLEVLKKEFPAAKVFARRKIVAAMKRTAPAKFAYWKPIYKTDLTDSFEDLYPEVFTSRSFTVDGQEVELIDFNHGESQAATAFYIPSAKALITGDVAYNGVHLWLADDEGNSERWVATLNELKSGHAIEKVYPGHGRVSTAALLDANIKYIQAFEEALKKDSKEKAIASLKKSYPNYRLPVIAEISVGAKKK